MQLVAQIEILNAKLSMSAFGAMHGLAVSAGFICAQVACASLVQCSALAAAVNSANMHAQPAPAGCCFCLPHRPVCHLVLHCAAAAGRGSQAGGAGAGHAERADGGGHGAGDAGGTRQEQAGAGHAAHAICFSCFRHTLCTRLVAATPMHRPPVALTLTLTPLAPPLWHCRACPCRSTPALCWVPAWASQRWMPSLWTALIQRQWQRRRRRQQRWLRRALTQLVCRRHRELRRHERLPTCPPDEEQIEFIQAPRCLPIYALPCVAVC